MGNLRLAPRSYVYTETNLRQFDILYSSDTAKRAMTCEYSRQPCHTEKCVPEPDMLMPSSRRSYHQSRGSPRILRQELRRSVHPENPLHHSHAPRFLSEYFLQSARWTRLLHRHCQGRHVEEGHIRRNYCKLLAEVGRCEEAYNTGDQRPV